MGNLHGRMPTKSIFPSIQTIKEQDVPPTDASKGKPVSIIAPQSVSPADIWTFSTTQLTTVNTTGQKLNSLKNASYIVDGEIIL